MRNFRTYDLAVEFYKSVKSVQLPAHLKSQLLRAGSSIALNLAEGYGKFESADQKRFFKIAFGSIRECQSIFDLADGDLVQQAKLLDYLAASLYKLLKAGS